MLVLLSLVHLFVMFCFKSLFPPWFLIRSIQVFYQTSLAPIIGLPEYDSDNSSSYTCALAEAGAYLATSILTPCGAITIDHVKEIAAKDSIYTHLQELCRSGFPQDTGSPFSIMHSCAMHALWTYGTGSRNVS